MNRWKPDRETTAAVKGIALIFMFVHHFFTFPGFYVEGVSYPYLAEFVDDYCVSLKLCVPVFAFLTGYFYAFRRERTLRYSLGKITELYLSYWFVYLPMLALALVTGCGEFSKRGIFQELLAVNTPLMIFCWYVWFYAAVMLLLPLLTRSREHTPWEDVLMLLVLPAASCSVLAMVGLEGFPYQLVVEVRDWFPCVASGYLCSKYQIFENFFARGLNRLRAPIRALCLGAMALGAFYGRYYCQYWQVGSLHIRGGEYDLLLTMDVFYAPLFVCAAVQGLQNIRKTPVFSLLGAIGKQSMLMWFLHCIFFNPLAEWTQRLVYAPREPILVTIFALALCYGGARLIHWPLQKALNWKRNLLRGLEERLC